MSCYFYVQTEPTLWTVGYEDATGRWHTDSDHEDRESAARRVAWLNGAPNLSQLAEIFEAGASGAALSGAGGSPVAAIADALTSMEEKARSLEVS